MGIVLSRSGKDTQVGRRQAGEWEERRAHAGGWWWTEQGTWAQGLPDAHENLALVLKTDMIVFCLPRICGVYHGSIGHSHFKFKRQYLERELVNILLIACFPGSNLNTVWLL